MTSFQSRFTTWPHSSWKDTLKQKDESICHERYQHSSQSATQNNIFVVLQSQALKKWGPYQVVCWDTTCFMLRNLNCHNKRFSWTGCWIILSRLLLPRKVESADPQGGSLPNWYAMILWMISCSFIPFSETKHHVQIRIDSELNEVVSQKHSGIMSEYQRPELIFRYC